METEQVNKSRKYCIPHGEFTRDGAPMVSLSERVQASLDLLGPVPNSARGALGCSFCHTTKAMMSPRWMPAQLKLSIAHVGNDELEVITRSAEATTNKPVVWR